MSIAIKVENLSKIYRLGQIGTGTVSRDLERWVKTKVLGQEDPFLRIGESNDRSTKGANDIVYSLRDINFEIEQGDAVGIIGRNGAGKSTLLKILSRVTAPTTGRISVKGRIASLLEVGTGFHPELTGRENIYLNGAMLGMRRKEIDRKLDEIVDFSGVERYLDTPVKRYSSGMYVRLAFAVAAHLESEILIVDEVLAVGDAEFQKKCLGKMGDVSKGEGRTVLFVSHNMAAVSELCTNGLLLNNGYLEFQGTSVDCISKYLIVNTTQLNSSYCNPKGSAGFTLSEVYFTHNAHKVSNIRYCDDINLGFEFENYESKPDGATITIVIKDRLNKPISATHNLIAEDAGKSKYVTTMVIPSKTLLPGIYKFDIILHIPNIEFIAEIKDKLELSIEDSGHLHSPFPGHDFGNVTIPVYWRSL